MFSGAGEAVSRRRWVSLSALLISLTFALMYCFFTGFPVCFSLTFGGTRSLRTSRRRRVIRFFGVVSPATLSLRLFSALAMRREDSLTTALFRFTVTLPVEFTSGCRRSSHDVDSVQAIQPPMELNFQLTSSLFPSLGSPEPSISLWFAPLQSYGTRSTRFTSVDPNFIGSSSLSLPLKVKLHSPACILSSDCTVHLRRSLSGILSSDTEVQFRSAAFLSSSTAKCQLTVQFDWAWPICVIKSGSPSLILPKPKAIEVMNMSLLSFGGWVNLYDISSFSRCVLPYFSCGMILQVGSPGLGFTTEYLLPPYLLSMKGDVSLVSLPSISFFTDLPSCVAVCTGSGDATKITSVFLVGESWLSTSPPYVTISHLSDFVVKVLSTQSNFALIPLSSSNEEPSILTYFGRIVYLFNLRGWLIPSFSCNRTS